MPCRAAESSSAKGTLVAVDVFHVDELVTRLDASRHDFADFFRAGTLSLTIACWPAGSIDEQEPHAEDEVYYVVRGRAKLRVGADDGDVSPGTLAYVAAGVEHRFHSIEDDLQVLVFWSPPRRRL